MSVEELDEAPARRKRPVKPINHRRRRAALAVSIIVLLIAIAVIAWSSLQHSNDPDYQARITLMDMSGPDTYLVNLWTNPHPLQQGSATLTVQVTSDVGTAKGTDSASIVLVRPNNQRLAPVQAKQLPANQSPADGLQANVNFDQPGAWQIIVDTVNGGQKQQSSFGVDIP
ncbi:MAG TPA: hypothetical protein VKU87_02835 [Thermomicrobiaceae bacterium]|nr:hypothetical protein [Thermomicrobiaceae bacterium]